MDGSTVHLDLDKSVCDETQKNKQLFFFFLSEVLINQFAFLFILERLLFLLQMWDMTGQIAIT